MTKIITKIDAVNHRKDIATMLPADLELTPAQRQELYELEGQINNRYNKIDYTISNSTNPGVHYFALENKKYTHLAGNTSISETVAFLLTIRTPLPSDRPFRFYANISTNPVVQGNVTLFKSLLRTASEAQKTIPYAYETVVSGFFNNMSEATDPALFLYINDLALGMMLTEDFKKLIITWVNNNHARLEQHLKDTNNDLAGLPASWLLTVWGYLDEGPSMFAAL